LGPLDHLRSWSLNIHPSPTLITFLRTPAAAGNLVLQEVGSLVVAEILAL